jgi:hypothetical protein
MRLSATRLRVTNSNGSRSFDGSASAYIAAVEAADGQSLEAGVKTAINDFVVGCKADGIWDAIKASCILAGARTLSGSLVPLAGTAPTNNNFVSGDYDRKTGLVGNAVNKYLNSNRNNNADPQNSCHQSCYFTAAGSAGDMFVLGAGVVDAGSTSLARLVGGSLAVRNRSASDGGFFGSSSSLGLYASNRASSTAITVRSAQTNTTQSLNSQTPFNANVFVFGSNTGSVVSLPTNSRLAFYSIGESLDLALLDARVTALITAFGVAIP